MVDAGTIRHLLHQNRYGDALDQINDRSNEKSRPMIKLHMVKILFRQMIYSSYNYTSNRSKEEFLQQIETILNSLENMNNEENTYFQLLMLRYNRYWNTNDTSDLIAGGLKALNPSIFDQYTWLRPLYMIEYAALQERNLGTDASTSEVERILQIHFDNAEIAIELKQFDDLADILYQISFLFMQRSNEEFDQSGRSLEIYYQIKKLVTHVNEIWIKVLVLFPFAITFHFMGKYRTKEIMEAFKDLMIELENIHNTHDLPSSFKVIILNLRGHLELSHGKYQRAIDYYNKAIELEISPNTLAHEHCYLAMGYHTMGEVEKFHHHAKIAVKAGKNEITWVQFLYLLFAAEIDEGELIDQIYPKFKENIEQLLDEVRGKNVDFFTVLGLIADGLMFKRSTRLRDKIRAQECFEEIVENYHIWPLFFSYAMFNLLDLLLYEFKLEQNSAIKDAIELNLKRFDDYLSIIPNPRVKADVLLIRARFSSLKNQPTMAKEYLTDARYIAEENEFEVLTSTISQYMESLDNISQIEDTDIGGDMVVQQVIKRHGKVEKNKYRQYIKKALDFISEQ